MPAGRLLILLNEVSYNDHGKMSLDRTPISITATSLHQSAVDCFSLQFEFVMETNVNDEWIAPVSFRLIAKVSVYEVLRALKQKNMSKQLFDVGVTSYCNNSRHQVGFANNTLWFGWICSCYAKFFNVLWDTSSSIYYYRKEEISVGWPTPRRSDGCLSWQLSCYFDKVTTHWLLTVR